MATDHRGIHARIVILVTVYIASVSNNRRIDDLRTDLNKRIDDLNAEMRDWRAEMRDGFRKLEERIEHPITRP